MTRAGTITPLGVVFAAALAIPGPSPAAEWVSGGGDLKNSRHQASEETLSPKNVGQLKLLWSVATAGDVTASPAVDDEHVYFPDSAGYLYKVRRDTGSVVWVRAIADYTGIPGDFARATPAIHGNLLILGNQSGKIGAPNSPAPARVFALDKRTGAPVWTTQVDDTMLSFVTQSAVVHKGTVYVGTASNEELIAAFVPQAFWTWSFRGAAVALDAATGAIRWKTYTVPSGFYGGAIWGSTPAIDSERNTVYMTTGNNYWVPTPVVDCIKGGTPAAACMPADNHFDSILAIDATTGAVKWASRGLDSDIWSVACGLRVPGVFTVPANPDNCPAVEAEGPDWDFAQGVIIFGDDKDGGRYVGAGQKSGMYWTFDAKTGALTWATQVAPGGVTGGLQWGSASDGRRLYVAVSNSGPSMDGGGAGAGPWLQKDGSTVKNGGWAALDRKTGEVLWTTPDKDGSRAEGAVTVAGDVVFGCNVDYRRGTVRALDAKTGKLLWSYDTGGACTAAPSVADGMVFMGSGNFIMGSITPKRVFAFGL
jgi:polyvinyl alcohol dehydrogenase (cytochrome)